MPSNPNPKPQEPQEPLPPAPCEFTTPCPATAEANNPRRKVISHIFGRNKAATKRFPTHVWVHYCRQHYQRARYRVDWPFTQCELLQVVLGRMEQWGGVKGWEVVLRKREEERLRGGMQISCGRENEGGGIVSNAWDTDVIVSSASSSGGGEGGSMLRGRRKPVVVSSPVPAWLLMEVGRGRSFADLRGLVCRVRGYLDALRERGVPGDRIVFPDIELLPVFQSWVLAPVVKKRRRRVNGNGVV